MPLERSLHLGAVLLLGALPAAAQTAGPEESLAVAERAAAAAVSRDGIAAGLSTALAADGAVLWPGAPLVLGPGPTRQLLAAQRSLDSLHTTWQPLGLEVSRDGSLGVSWGVAVSAGGVPRVGRYIAAWRRTREGWKLAAFVPLGLVAPSATPLPTEISALRHAPLAATGNAAAFISADIAFALLAADSGAARAFERYAAPDALMFGGGLLQRGPAAIGRLIGAGPPSRWAWHPVLAGASEDGELGYTVGESVIRPHTGAVNYGKYLTIWRRLPGGEVRFFTDGGNARPEPR